MKVLTEKKEEFIKNKLKEPDEYKIRYVAFLDILGFKKITTEKDCAIIKALFNDIELIKFSFDNPLANTIFGENLVEDVDFTIMSDSIVISTPNTYEGLAYLLFICATIQSRLFLLPDQMTLLRGGISNGKYFKLNNLSFGPALTEAYTLENTHSKVPRIILHTSITESLESNGIIGKSYLSESTSECKNLSVSSIIKTFLSNPMEDEYYFVDFLNPLELLRLFHRDKTKNSLITRIQNLLKEGLESKDVKVQEKYEWLNNYFNDKISKSPFPNIKSFIIKAEGEQTDV